MSTDTAGLYRLMAWLSPSYPVGAFTLSHGLEWVVEDGVVADADQMVAWVGDVLAHGAGRQDAILLAAAYRARQAEILGDPDAKPASDSIAGDWCGTVDANSAHSGESRNPGPYDGPLHTPPWTPAFAGVSGARSDRGDRLDSKGEASAFLADIVELAAALNPSMERRTETISQGEAFRKITEAAWPPVQENRETVFRPEGRDVQDPPPAHSATREGLPWPDGPLAYPVAVAIAAADHGVDLGAVLAAYLHAFAANIVSAGVRLIPLGQTDGQRAIARLESAIAALADEAAGSTLDDLGGCALLADIASMRHETQYTRLFRT